MSRLIKFFLVHGVARRPQYLLQGGVGVMQDNTALAQIQTDGQKPEAFKKQLVGALAKLGQSMVKVAVKCGGSMLVELDFSETDLSDKEQLEQASSILNSEAAGAAWKLSFNGTNNAWRVSSSHRSGVICFNERSCCVLSVIAKLNLHCVCAAENR